MLEPSRPCLVPDTSVGLHTKRAADSVTALGDLPDLLLVERARSRDPRAFETLMRRYNRRLFRIARSIVRDAAAEEAVRSTHVRAFGNLDRYEPAGKFGSWIARLAFSEALTLRKNPSMVAARSSASGDSTGERTDRELIENAIDALPEVFRTVLVLRVVEELSGVDVAACLGLNETTVRTRLFRAQQRLTADLTRRLRAERMSIFELTAERGDRIVTQVLAQLPRPAATSEAR